MVAVLGQDTHVVVAQGTAADQALQEVGPPLGRTHERLSPPPGVDGAINQLPLAQPAVVPAISFVGTYGANVAYLGAAAFEVAGVSQLNVVVGIPTSSQGVLDVTIGNFLTGVTVYVAP